MSSTTPSGQPESNRCINRIFSPELAERLHLAETTSDISSMRAAAKNVLEAETALNEALRQMAGLEEIRKNSATTNVEPIPANPVPELVCLRGGLDETMIAELEAWDAVYEQAKAAQLWSAVDRVDPSMLEEEEPVLKLVPNPEEDKE